MNAILYYDFGPNKINGSLLNMIEYYLAAYEHNKNIQLLLINSNEQYKQAYIEMIKERYILDGLDGFENNIISIRRNALVRKRFDVTLSHSTGTVYNTKGIINTKELMVLCDYFLDNPDYFYSKALYNVTYYGEMPFQYKDLQYNFKMLFNRYKLIPHSEDNLYIHSPQNKDRSFLKEIQLPDKPMIFRGDTHVKNFFASYKTFVYYHAHKWFDPSPRLMHESYFYGKDIMYFNKWGLKDGSFYRYYDLLENGLTHRILNKNDEIVQRLI